MAPKTQLVDVPLIGMQRETGGDSGGFSYAEGLTQTAQNEWQPTGAMVDTSVYPGFTTYDSTVPATDVQSPDLVLFENRNQIHALNFDKYYNPTSDSRTLRDPSTVVDLIYSNASSGRSFQVPLETISLKMFDFGTANGPVTFSHSLDCFVGYQNQFYFDSDGRQNYFNGLVFFSKYTGRKLNDQVVIFPLDDFSPFNKSSLTHSNKCFVTEDSSGAIGVLGYSRSGSNPNRPQEHFVAVTEETLPDKKKSFKAASYIPTPGYIGPFDGTIIGYTSFVATDGSGAIIDIIATIGAVGGMPPVVINVETRKDRVQVSSLTFATTVGDINFSANGAVEVSDFSNDVTLAWSFIENAGPLNSGVSYHKFTINKNTGALALAGAEVVVALQLKAVGEFFNAFSIYDLRKAPGTYYEIIIAQQELANGNLETLGFNSFTGATPLAPIDSLYNMLLCSQPVKTENSFTFIGSFKNPDISLEFGQCYVSFSNYTSNVRLSFGPQIEAKLSGVIGYNETFGNSYSQIGYSPDTRLSVSASSSEDEGFVRITQVGVCDSLRPVRFNGETYFFSGFQYLANPDTGLEKVGVYTTPDWTASTSGVGPFNSTVNFRLSYLSFGGEGPISQFKQVIGVGNSQIDFQINVVCTDIDRNLQGTYIDENIRVYAEDPADGLYKQVLNSRVGLPTFTGGVYSFSLDVSGGSISYGNVASFESGEAPCVGLNSPRLASLALGRIVCTDEFSEKIYTSKEQSEASAAEFSDVLFINASPASEPITEIAELNNSMVVFSDESIYAITGRLPDSFGDQSLSEWQLISNSLGCYSARSTLASDAGVFFSSTDGIYLLNRGYQTQPISKFRGFLPLDEPTLSQDFWHTSASQEGTENIFFSTSSLRSRLSDADFVDKCQVLDSIFVFNQKFGTFGLFSPESSKVLGVSGKFGGAFMTEASTTFLAPTLNNETFAIPGTYDTGFFCPFGAFTYGVVSSVYVKLFKVGTLPGSYAAGFEPTLDVYVRDDETSTESHVSSQTMESPIPDFESGTFLWRVRLSNRRCNAIRVILKTGIWGIRGMSLEVVPQPGAGGVKRQLQGVT